MNIEKIFKQKPLFINEKGVKWWVDKDLTEYGRKEDINGISVYLTVFLVEEPSGCRTRIIVLGGEPVYSNSKMEDICFRIDIMKKYELLKVSTEEEDVKRNWQD